MADPAFRSKVAGLRREAVEQALNLLSASMADADAQLHLLAPGGEAPNVRLRAAAAILELGLKFQQAYELEERLRSLEVQLQKDVKSDS
jgi:hypothetical protein